MLRFLLSLGFVVSACTPADDGSWANDSLADGTNELAQVLTEKYGLAPKIYPFLFNRSNEAEQIFSDTMTSEATRLSALSRTLSFHEGELGINAITEGAIFPLKENQLLGIDGYHSMGIDSLVGNIGALKRWLPAALAAEIEQCDMAQFTECENDWARPHCGECSASYEFCIGGGQDTMSDCQQERDACEANCKEQECSVSSVCPRMVTNQNERGEALVTMFDLTLEEALSANASMYAFSKAVFEKDSMRIYSQNSNDLSLESQFFWSTMYFNAGAGTAGKRLKDKGLAYADQKWPGGKQSNLNPQFNALWRTASFEYVMTSVYGQ